LIGPTDGHGDRVAPLDRCDSSVRVLDEGWLWPRPVPGQLEQVCDGLLRIVPRQPSRIVNGSDTEVGAIEREGQGGSRVVDQNWHLGGYFPGLDVRHEEHSRYLRGPRSTLSDPQPVVRSGGSNDGFAAIRWHRDRH